MLQLAALLVWIGNMGPGLSKKLAEKAVEICNVCIPESEIAEGRMISIMACSEIFSLQMFKITKDISSQGEVIATVVEQPKNV
jgi:hypothetical protein